jgi:hypothetical protein
LSDRVNLDLRLIGVENPEEMAKDRERWEEVVATAKGLNGLYKAKKIYIIIHICVYTYSSYTILFNITLNVHILDIGRSIEIQFKH